MGRLSAASCFLFLIGMAGCGQDSRSVVTFQFVNPKFRAEAVPQKKSFGKMNDDLYVELNTRIFRLTQTCKGNRQAFREGVDAEMKKYGVTRDEFEAYEEELYAKNPSRATRLENLSVQRAHKLLSKRRKH